MTVTTHLDPPSVSVAPGGEQQVTVRIRNEGDIVESYRLEVVGDASGWSEVEPQALSLLPGDSGTARLTLRPPRSHDLHAGLLPYAVRVQPSERADGTVVPEGTIDVLTFDELETQLLPRTVSGRLRARSQVEIRNRGNSQAKVRLTAEDPAERLGIALKPAAVDLEPGELRYVSLTVRSRRRMWRGKVKAHPFEVRLTADEGPDGRPTVLAGTYEQLPVVPGWAYVLAAGAAAAAALWFAAVRPAVTSAARQSVAAAVKQAVQQAVSPTAAPAGASAQPAGGSSPSAGPQSGGTAGAKAGAAGGSAGATGSAGAVGVPNGQYSKTLSISVTKGDQRDATFTVPSNRFLLLTDIVAYAPQGDEGTLTVSIDGQQVLSLALENFRDHDSPWVTPIQAPPKSQIVLSVACRKPGTPADASAAPACAESLVVSGTSVTPPAPTSTSH
ncbi:hydrolytic protein [Streptomyces sp. GbtcB6]|uniref:COG1470 family protein n=1 Tax=Streptomyces sp. GbtcB6 TaxID=2824751 RepID=UPI001C3104B2|nr:hydrolytic protein [Streptomyces sp. GbtcB6]